jgi:hypothetical protein
MTRARIDERLDAAVPALIAACVLAAAAGSSIQRDVLALGRPGRWALLVILLAFALVRAAASLPVWRVPRATTFAVLAFCGLALASAAWSVNPHGTLVRSLALLAVVVAIVALLGCLPARPDLGDRMLTGVLAAAGIVAFAGFVYWLVSPSHAAIAATTEYPSRYQGIEQNPNTAPLLLAIAVPIAFVRALRAETALRRIGFGIVLVGLLASIVASGSRGGIVAAFAGLLAVTVFGPFSRLRKLAVGTAVVVAFAASAWLSTIPKALPAVPVATGVPAVAASPSANAELVLPLNQEIGNPWWTRTQGDSRRSLFNTNVRARAWEGTYHRALGRPLLGYGFGAEQWAFVNRYYAFDSQNPENAYLGLFLQLGVVGPIVFLATAALCVVAGARASLRGSRTALAAVGATAAALAAGLSQSYFHGPGGIAFVALWMSLLVCGTAVAR